jgi:hypothetical protein
MSDSPIIQKITTFRILTLIISYYIIFCKLFVKKLYYFIDRVTMVTIPLRVVLNVT